MAWSILYRHRVEARTELGDIWRLPLIKRYVDRLHRHLASGARVLEIGSGNNALGGRLRQACPDLIYRTLDVDRTHPHDYYRLEDVEERFDLIVLIEVIEHLDLESGIDLLDHVRRLLNPNGRIVLTTPNVFHPTRYWGDCTHRTFYRYDDLAGILRALGYRNVGVFRIYNAPFFARLFRLHVARYLHQYLGIDFALSILVEGTAS